ncbi:TetR family transcriptional regulator [Sneathiella sp. P13V-1]|uniref:TetR/AcrR family transcriptional regulator n=1 Tax=Sneathiella sp. P13V-1 TaxID=2697366 RepID=UPI00187B3D96|nr:TetR/AcrR family transcriptional regulator [Sneathiella sp. P13V-1]MBE7638391.1 TetR family transcriptional regulator [Sneathiella sp. P13V-1]
MNASLPEGKNAQRSALTREKVLKATLDQIYECGILAASTPEIVKRAGISRGAMLHHFPSKEQLIAAAVEKLLEDEVALIEKEAEAYADHEKSIDDFVDFLWERFSGRLFMITMDFLSSARTDEKLREAVIPVSLNFHTSLNQIWIKFFPHKQKSTDQIQLLLNTTMCLMRGMGVQTVIKDDPTYFDGIREYWKTLIHSQLD